MNEASLLRERLLRAAVDAAQIGCWGWDLRSNQVEISDWVEPILGLEHGQFERSYDAFLDLIHPSEREQAARTIIASLRGESDRYELEHRVVWPDGSLHWIEAKGAVERDAEGNALRLSGTLADITRRKASEATLVDLRDRGRAEAAIKASEARLRRVVASPILGFAFSDAEGLLTEANEECLRIIGYTREELARGAVSLRSLTPHEPQTSKQGALLEVAETGRSRPRELELRRKDGRHVPVLLGLSALDDERSDEVIFVFDLSTRRELERQLQHAQRMEAVGRLAAGIAHDFNNVLSAITMSGDLLRDTLSPGHPGREDLIEIRKAADRAIRLVRQLLAFSRQQVLEPRVLDLNDLVLQLEGMLRRLVGEEVAISTTYQSGLGAIRADPGQLEQVLVNLTVNARDAMPLGGVLSIETSEVDFEPQRVVDRQDMAPGRYVVLSVEDDGMGMEPQTRARIFEPFFTTKEPGKGTGLGLSTVYGIVRQSGGAIDVTSELGRGTSFRIYLPCVEAPIESVRPTGVPESASGTETVLVVDDDASVRQITRKLLVALGYRVLDAATPAAAVALSEVYVGGIDVLLSDLALPGSSGRALAQTLVEQRPKLRVLFMSGMSDQEQALLGGADGGADFIQKPFSSAELAHKLRVALEHT